MSVLSHDEILAAARQLLIKIKPLMSGSGRGHGAARPLRLYGIPRGGVSAAMALKIVACAEPEHRYFLQLVDLPEQADLLVDDIVDSGETRARYINRGMGNQPFATLYTKRPASDVENDFPLYGTAVASNDWIVFPWEEDAIGSATDVGVRLLQFIGEDPDREGLRDTPARFLRAWKEWTVGYSQDPKAILKCFEDGADRVDEIILVRDIPFYSQCEHHLAPFFGIAHIAYIPNGKIVGLSKLPRLVDVFAKRLQVQERMTNDIADAIKEVLDPIGIAVVIEARHLCMESRGINRPGSTTVTSAMRGAFLEKPAARAEFFSILNRRPT